MKIITCASWKGGTGKTSLSVAAIETLAKLGKTILIIDLDSNCSITVVYDKFNKENYNSINLIYEEDPKGKIGLISNNENINIIPSDLKICKQGSLSDRIILNRIKNFIDPEKYDYIFIDPPGTMNDLTRNALVASDKIIVPATFSEMDYAGTIYILHEMEECGIDADITIVLNRYDSQRNPPGIEKMFRENEKLKDFLWSKNVPKMSSIPRLTNELQAGYQLQGLAKQIISNFVQEVILC